MQSIDRLVEQNILEADSHLRHIDELMAKAARPPGHVTRPADLAALLDEIKSTRERFSSELDQLRGGISRKGYQQTAEPAVRLKSTLQEAGDQYERALTAIFDRRGV